MKKMRAGVLAVFALLAACTASLPPAETTVDGLVRVPSRPEEAESAFSPLEFGRGAN
jgi:hypothetical protein